MKRIAYGILRTQLFDIDLRIHWTIKQSTFGKLWTPTYQYNFSEKIQILTPFSSKFLQFSAKFLGVQYFAVIRRV
jgi:hypothetical protein